MSNVINSTLALRLFFCCDNGNDILSTLNMIADGFTESTKPEPATDTLSF
jgi:hypothetical protein